MTARVKRCCPDYDRICSKSPSKSKCWRSVLGAYPEIVNDFRISDVVNLDSKRSRIKTFGCECEDADHRDPDRANHENKCNRSLVWIVRVKYDTESRHTVTADSIRLCAADAARVRQEYRNHGAEIIRVYPLYRR